MGRPSLKPQPKVSSKLAKYNLHQNGIFIVGSDNIGYIKSRVKELMLVYPDNVYTIFVEQPDKSFKEYAA